jgi:large subunit ribosomal protein L22
MHKAQVYAKHNKARISPKKVAIVMDMVRGENLHNAKRMLAFDSTKASKMILKVVRSAEANAKNNHNLDPKNLYLSDIYVNPGAMQKWGRPASRMRFSPILKRSSHIVVGLSSKEEAKPEKKTGRKILSRKK